MSEPAKHLDAAGEAVRAFIHATLTTGPDWEYPGHAYTAIGNLSHMVGMLEQAVQQSSRPVEYTHRQGRIRVDGGGDAGQAVRELLAAQADAERAAAALTAAVQRMHNAVGPMGADVSGLPEFEDGSDA